MDGKELRKYVEGLYMFSHSATECPKCHRVTILNSPDGLVPDTCPACGNVGNMFLHEERDLELCKGCGLPCMVDEDVVTCPCGYDPENDSRPTRDQYFMGFARQAATRATCDRGRSGAVIVVGGQVVSTGYVGAARGLDHCDDVGHLIRLVIYLDEEVHEDDAPLSDRGLFERIDSDGIVRVSPIREHCIGTAHAEGNAIVQAAKHGIAINGGTMYCKMEPCLRCCVDIINAGIVRVVAEYRYHGGRLTRKWFEKAGVELSVLNDEEPDYSNKEETSASRD